MPELKFRLVHEVIVIVHSAKEPSQAEWDALISFGASFPGDYLRLRSLVWSAGGGPNKAQRAQLLKVNAGRPHKVAMIMASALVRALVCVLGWTNQDLKAFSPSNLDAALKHLKVPGHEQDAVLRTLDVLMEQMNLRPPEARAEASF